MVCVRLQATSVCAHGAAGRLRVGVARGIAGPEGGAATSWYFLLVHAGTCWYMLFLLPATHTHHVIALHRQVALRPAVFCPGILNTGCGVAPVPLSCVTAVT
jgi:hypothetical protein